MSNEPVPGHAYGPFGELILILPGSVLTQRVGSLAGSQAAPTRQSRDGIVREHVRVGSPAPCGCRGWSGLVRRLTRSRPASVKSPLLRLRAMPTTRVSRLGRLVLDGQVPEEFGIRAQAVGALTG